MDGAPAKYKVAAIKKMTVMVWLQKQRSGQCQHALNTAFGINSKTDSTFSTTWAALLAEPAYLSSSDKPVYPCSAVIVNPYRFIDIFYILTIAPLFNGAIF